MTQNESWGNASQTWKESARASASVALVPPIGRGGACVVGSSARSSMDTRGSTTSHPATLGSHPALISTSNSLMSMPPNDDGTA